MRALTEEEIQGSFDNHEQAHRIPMPWLSVATLWDTLDDLGRIDPAAPQRASLVAETSTNRAPVLDTDEVRRLRRAVGGGALPETHDEERRILSLRRKLGSFIDRMAA